MEGEAEGMIEREPSEGGIFEMPGEDGVPSPKKPPRSRGVSIADMYEEVQDSRRSQLFKKSSNVMFGARRSTISKPPPSDEVSRLIAIMLAASSKNSENRNDPSDIYDYDEDEEEEIEKHEGSVLSTKGERAAVKLRSFQRNALVLGQYHDDYVMELTLTIENLVNKLHRANVDSATLIDNIKKETALQDEGNVKDMAHKREQLDMVLQSVMKTVTRWRRKIDKFETSMRKKRNQHESRLEGIIERYDAEMTNRQELLDTAEGEENEVKAEVTRLDNLFKDVQRRWEVMIAEIHVRQVDEAMRNRMKKKPKKGAKGKGKKGGKKGGSKKKGSKKEKGKKGKGSKGGSKKKGGGKSKKGNKGGKKKKSKSGESGEDESEFEEETGEEYDTTDAEEGATSGEESAKKSKGKKGSAKAKGKSKAGGKKKDEKVKEEDRKDSKRSRSPPTPPPKDLEMEEEEEEGDFYADDEEMEGEFDDRPRTDSQQSEVKSKPGSVKKKDGKPKKAGKKAGGKKKK